MKNSFLTIHQLWDQSCHCLSPQGPSSMECQQLTLLHSYYSGVWSAYNTSKQTLYWYHSVQNCDKKFSWNFHNIFILCTFLLQTFQDKTCICPDMSDHVRIQTCLDNVQLLDDIFSSGDQVMTFDTLTCNRLEAPKSAIFTFPLESLKMLAPTVIYGKS